MWHISDGVDNTFRIKLRLDSGTATISASQRRVEVVTTNEEFVAAQCIDKATAYGLGLENGQAPSLSTTEAELLQKVVPGSTGTPSPKPVLGAIREFTVTAATDTNLRNRTMIGTPPPAESADPWFDANAARHVRGWWPFSEASFNAPGDLDLNPLAISNNQIWCPISESNDANGNRIVPQEMEPDVFGHREEDTYGWPLPFTPQGNLSPLGGNVGLYGAVVKYVFSLFNSSEDLNGAASVLFYRRNTGASAVPFGAAQIDLAGYPQWFTPYPPTGLQWDPTTGAQSCRLTFTANGDTLIVLPPLTAMMVAVKFSAAAASGLPANLVMIAGRVS